ncbi:MAG TPA: hypothetical protein VH328_05645 [Burkholderiaceae bacterium]|jgi:hypothetical protein|nr:hypothetical protein [Burkholderiaceae bacterium]
MRTLVLLAGLGLLVACGDDDSGIKMTMDLSVAVFSPDMAYPSSCGFPGDKGVNSLGVGLFCMSLVDCEAPDGSMGWKATLCSNLGDPTSHFCTFQCDPATVNTQGECGDGATCVCGDIGCGCTPHACVPKPDAGP